MGKVILEKKEHIAVLTLNNPKSLNALNVEFMKEISNSIDEVNNSEDIYVLIITGKEKAFIAGADIKEMLPLSGAETLEWAQLGSDLNTKIENLRIPVIAALNGFTLGGGCELALSCDIRIASEKAKFGQPEVGLGITPGAGGTQRLPRIVGVGKAKELLYTGKIIDAEEALEINLVNKIVPSDKLLDECIDLAKEISKNAQIAVQQTKRAVNRGIETDVNTGLSYELQAFSVCNSTEDKKIGMEAFINKSKEKNFQYK
ncbi:MAG: crotonase [Firmicutes bacterium]|nr:crotonase [Bacillota bacterium]